MSSVFSYNTRDIKFIFKEWLPMDDIFAYERFNGYYSTEDLDSFFNQVHKIAAEVLAPVADELEDFGVKFENGKVMCHPSYRKVFKYIQENGWGTSNIDEEGEGCMPESLFCGVSEMFIAALPAMAATGLTTGAARLIQSYGTPELKKMFLPKMYDGTWSGTMCLTEPTVGSDVGDLLSKAYPTDDPRIYKIKGTKQFITCGDGDFADNIIHLYLARIEGAAPGSKGISLFVVPKYWVNEDGSMGEWNDVTTTAIEHKMGLHGQPTAALSCGENDNCRGWLLGDPPGPDGIGQGMAQMFQMMNEERQGTGLQALAVAANAYWNAKNYAKERVQGRLMSNPKAGRVEIINHADVKRMLMLNKATLEACRAMIAKCYFYLDVRNYDSDPAKRKAASDMVEILTPICKAYPSDEAWLLVAESIQTYGGYGYCEEYPVAQAARDVKIYSIWEGTNFIQAQDLVGRKWTMGKGVPFQNFLKEIADFAVAHQGHPGLEKEFANLLKAVQSYKEIMITLNGFMQAGKLDYFQVYARRILTATAQMYGSYCLLEQALIAQKKMEELGKDHYDYNYYYGKVLSSRYYTRNSLPFVWSLLEIMKDGDSSIIDAPVDIFEY